MEDDINIFEMEDNINIFENRRRPQIFFNGRRPQKIKQPKTIKSKIKHCGTAPGNLVSSILQANLRNA